MQAVVDIIAPGQFDIAHVFATVRKVQHCTSVKGSMLYICVPLYKRQNEPMMGNTHARDAGV